MSRTPSPDNRSLSREPRQMSVETPDEDRKRGRSEVEADPEPAKRPRADVKAKKEDAARGKRLFGNLLGTLQRFQKDDKTARTSEAAKRREKVAERIQQKIRSEATLHHDVAETERELKTLRIHTESLGFVLRHKEAAMLARHATLKPTCHFLHTSLPTPTPPVFEPSLLNPAPIPLNKGPAREPHPADSRPLYFIPKVLLPAQQSELDSQIANVNELITEEAAELAKEKTAARDTVEKNRAKIVELGDKLVELRAQMKPGTGPTKREERAERAELPSRRERESTRERESQWRREENVEEEGVQITGDDGDVELEY